MQASPATEIRPDPRPDTRTTGVCPRRPQVRATGGCSACRDSSSKQTHAPVAAASLVPPSRSRPARPRSRPRPAQRPGAPDLRGEPIRCSRYDTPRSVYGT